MKNVVFLLAIASLTVMAGEPSTRRIVTRFSHVEVTRHVFVSEELKSYLTTEDRLTGYELYKIEISEEQSQPLAKYKLVLAFRDPADEQECNFPVKVDVETAKQKVPGGGEITIGILGKPKINKRALVCPEGR